MENRSQKLYNSMKKFYVNDKLIALIDSVENENTDNVSLRLIDWLVTNYSKKNNVIYFLNGAPFNLHQNYKNMLKAYSKKLFDPFRRHSRVKLDCPYVEGGIIETTVAQMTFFKWAIECDVIKYANEHKQSIKDDMDSCSKNRKDTKTVPMKKPKVLQINFNVTFS